MERDAPGGLDLQSREAFIQRLESRCGDYYRRIDAKDEKLEEKDF